jgi:hypothetical protein
VTVQGRHPQIRQDQIREGSLPQII